MQAPQNPLPQPNFVPVRPKLVPQIPEQRHLGVAVERSAHPVNRECDHGAHPLVADKLNVSDDEYKEIQ